ncbi:MAG: acyl-CoA dehydrogenase family protein, partial [Candidatus Binatia bacterium]
MDFDLSDELIAVRDLARDFAEREIAPSAARDDRERAFRQDLVRKMGELGFYGCVIPETYGGSGLGFLALTLITEEIARAHSAMRVFINMQVGPALALLEFGAAEQKQRWLPPVVRGETLSCFAITEPDAGSDVSAIRTTAVRNDDGYTLNGTKIWISNGPVADTALVYAYTDRSRKHRGLSAFYVDLRQPGVSRRPLETMGTHASPIGELTFENLPVPTTRLIGNEGDGFKICMWQLNQTRLSCAA